MTHELLTVKQVAARLGVRIRAVYRLVQSGELPAYRIGVRLIRIDRAELDAWIAERKTTSRIDGVVTSP